MRAKGYGLRTETFGGRKPMGKQPAGSALKSHLNEWPTERLKRQTTRTPG